MNSELLQAVEMLEKERHISRESLFEAIESSLISACKNNFQFSRNNLQDTEAIHAEIDRETCDIHVYSEQRIVATEDDIEEPGLEITLEEAKQYDPDAEVGGVLRRDFDSKEFGRIASQNAKNVILQKIREEERGAIYNEYSSREHDIVTGVVQRSYGRNITINLGRADAILTENEQVRNEHLRPQERIKVYILEVKNNNKGPRILVSRTHPDLVRRLFEQEVTEIREGVVEIKSIAREPGSRTKIAVYSNNSNVDAVGACVGVNGTRVGMIVDELNGEKIDIVNWDENPGNFIQNALSPAKIVAVFADPDEHVAKVVVPDYQLSLAIGKEGQNARLAARLTGYKIDIKNETQAKDTPGFRYEDYLDDEMDDGEGYYEEYEYADGEYAEDGYVTEGAEEEPAEAPAEEAPAAEE